MSFDFRELTVGKPYENQDVLITLLEVDGEAILPQYMMRPNAEGSNTLMQKGLFAVYRSSVKL